MLGSLEKKVKEKPWIDPDLAPDNCMNLEAARTLGVRYDPKREVYRDADGYAVLDRYGQPLG